MGLLGSGDDRQEADRHQRRKSSLAAIHGQPFPQQAELQQLQPEQHRPWRQAASQQVCATQHAQHEQQEGDFVGTPGPATIAALARVEAIATAIKIVFNMDNSD
jgi:hypothetical protein